MVKSMNAAWRVPHFVYCDEIVMDNLIQLRGELKDLAASRGVKFSYLPLILKARWHDPCGLPLGDSLSP